MNHSRNLLSVAIAVFSAVQAYQYIGGSTAIPYYLKHWYISLILLGTPFVTCYFFGRIYFYGILTKNVMAVKESGEKEIREYEWKSRGIQDEDTWNKRFYSTAFDRIDCANVKYLRERIGRLMYVISGERLNVLTIIAAALTAIFAFSFAYEWWKASDASMSWTLFFADSILLSVLWFFQVRDIDSRFPLPEKRVYSKKQ